MTYDEFRGVYCASCKMENCKDIEDKEARESCAFYQHEKENLTQPQKHFIWGIICAKQEIQDAEKVDGYVNYYNMNEGDYILNGLYDITDPANPITVFHEDNTHSPIESMINNFFKGIDYMKIPYTLTSEVVFSAPDNVYSAAYKDLEIVCEGSTQTYNK